MTFYDELVWRGLIKDVSSEDLKDKLNAGGMTFYIGTDPYWTFLIFLNV
jgi:tyrosyl-tRNA synthetase